MTRSFQRHLSILQNRISQKEPIDPNILRRGLPQRLPLNGVNKIIAVSSGKGGVGKSTISVNLAISLSKLGYSTGLLDADIYGPSIPMMMNLNEHPKINPKRNYGVQCMSIGFLLDYKSAIVWRGLMVMKAIQQLLRQTDWDNLDYLVIDMPPGTGDIHLSITQLVPIAGAVVVTTPQDISLIDARKGADMFKKVDIPLLGLIQNMSYFKCPNCSHISHIFGNDGAKKISDEFSLTHLGDIPLNEHICIASDAGKPLTVSEPGSEISNIYSEIAKKVSSQLKMKE